MKSLIWLGARLRQLHISPSSLFFTRAEPTSILNLPNELIAEIMFCAVIASSPRTRPEVKLLLVCKRFRSVALATPALWTQLIFPLHLNVAHNWLKRSGVVPLEIEIEDADPQVAFFGYTSQGNVMDRCRVLILERCCNRFRVAMRRPAPLLEELHLRLCEQHLPDWTLGSDFLSLDAPKLRHVKLTDMPSLWPVELCASLTSLEIVFTRHDADADSDLLMMKLLHTLQNAPKLAKFTLSGACLRSFADERVAAISLPSIKEMCLRGHTLIHLVALLPLLSTPALGDLDLTLDEYSHLNVPNDAPAFFQSLFTLTVQGSATQHPSILKVVPLCILLRQCPHLSSITFSDMQISDLLFESLGARTFDSQLLAPKLEECNLYRCTGFTRRAMLDMCVSRARESLGATTDGSVLARVHAKACSGIGPETSVRVGYRDHRPVTTVVIERSVKSNARLQGQAGGTSGI